MEPKGLRSCVFCVHVDDGFCKLNPTSIAIKPYEDTCGQFLADLEAIAGHFNDEISWLERKVERIDGPREQDLKQRLFVAESNRDQAENEVESIKAKLEVLQAL